MQKTIRNIYISFVLSLIFMPIIKIQASGQACDLLIIETDTVCISSNPLYGYLLNNKHYDIPCTETGSNLSSCERGYIATWKIENDSLFLINISSCGFIIDSCLGKETLIEKIFGPELKNGRLYASWYSDKIVIPYGRLIRYVHMGYGSIYEFETQYIFKNGVVSDSLSFTNYLDTSEGLNRFDKLDVSISIYEHIKKNFDWDLIPDTPTWFMRFNISILANGQIGDVEYLDEEAAIYKDALVNALLNIGTFDIIKVQGRPIEETFRFKLEFDTLDKIIRDPNIDFEIETRNERKSI